MLTRDRLRQAVEILTKELNDVEAEITATQVKTKLDRAFFWSKLVPLLSISKEGTSSAEIYRHFATGGFRISQLGLRVFLSRYKERGELDLVDGKWRVSRSAAMKARRLGYHLEWEEEPDEEEEEEEE